MAAVASAEPQAVGRTILVNGREHTIVGVLPFTLLMTLFGAQLSAFFWRLLS